MSDTVLLGAESLYPGNGGICRVARLIAKVLIEQVNTGRISADSVVLSDEAVPADLALPAVCARGSRARFLLDVHRAALGHSHFIYDFLGMARAHCRLPGLRRPFMTYIHGIEVWEGSEASVSRLRRAKHAAMLVSNTAYTRDRAERVHGGFAHAKVCWLATEIDEPATAIAPGNGPPTVLILARIDQARYKGHEALIQCWPKVVSAVPDARLLIIGRGPGLESTQRLAAAGPVARQIEFRGFVPEEQMNGVWAESHVFAMPSRGEGFGLVYIEAMRFGRPVIASVHDAAVEVNVDGRTGYNVDLEKPDELPDRIIHLLKNRDAAAAMGEAGRRRWHEHFRYSSFRDRFTPLLQEFLNC